MMIKVLMQIVVLFSLISVGYICKKYRLLSNNMNQDIGNLLVYISLPSMIIVSLSSLTFSEKLMAETIQLLAISFGIYVLFVLLSYLLVMVLRVEGTTRDIFQFGLIFGNTSFMGFPVADALFGQQGVFFMAVCDVIFPIFAWTFGVMVMCRPLRKAVMEEGDTPQRLSMLKQIINPSIIAVCIGFLLLGTSTKLLEPVSDSLQLLGSLTTPLAMIFIGSALGDMEVKKIFTDVKAILCSLLRLILLPLMVFSILKILGFSGHLVNIPVLYASMPVAALSSVFAVKFGNDYYLASKLIFISTLLCICTIPVMVWIMLR